VGKNRLGKLTVQERPLKIARKKLPSLIQALHKGVTIGVSASALLIVATSASADSLVLNGSFEQNGGAGQINFNTFATDWTVPGNAGTSYTFLYAPGTADILGVTSGVYGDNPLWGPNDGSANDLPATSPDGGYFAASDADFQQSPIQQTINGLTAGDTYAVGFWFAASQQYSFGGSTDSLWQVSFGSQTQSTPDMSIPAEGFSGWQYQTFDFTADNASDLLSFFASNGQGGGAPPFALLDGVSVNQVTATPEPGSLPLLFTGLMCGIGALWTRKRRKPLTRG
jgi:hypothetical protein